MSLWDKVIFWVGKATYIAKSLVVPMVVFGWWQGLVGFLIMELVCGSRISWVFQLAHVQQKSGFCTPDPKTRIVHEEWAKCQVRTTADFSTNSKWKTWELGGLNFQTIHHLFSNVSHVHYRALQPLVIEVCKRFNIEYNCYDTMADAKKDHIKHLKEMGRRPMVAA